jgi:fibronectin-binding autotransporter adhesin
MAAISWASGVSGNWSDALDWTGGVVPGGGDDVTIDATGVYTVTISSAEAAHSLILNDAAATIAIDSGGTLNIGSTLTLDFGALQLNYGGVINGGTLSAMNGAFQWEAGTLNGVTYDGTINLSGASYYLLIGPGGLIMHGADGTGRGTINVARSESGTQSVLIFQGAQTIDNATINLSEGSFLGAKITAGESDTLTFGVDLTINQTGAVTEIEGDDSVAGDTIVNKGVINAAYAKGIFYVGPYGFHDGDVLTKLTNQGEVDVANGDTLELNVGTLINQGGVVLSSGGVLEQDGGTFVNRGVVTIGSGDSFCLYEATQMTNIVGATITATQGATLKLQGAIFNAGTITATDADVSIGGLTNTGVLDIDGCNVMLVGAITSGSLNALANKDNVITLDGGTIDNTGATLALGGGYGLGTLVVESGTIEGGMIIDSGGGLVLEGGNLQNLTYSGTLNVTGGVGLDGVAGEGVGGIGPATINVNAPEGAVTLAGNLSNLDININNSGSSTTFYRDEILDDTSLNVSGSSDDLEFFEGNITGSGTINLFGSDENLDFYSYNRNDNQTIDGLTLNFTGANCTLDFGNNARRESELKFGPHLTINQTGQNALITSIKSNYCSIDNYGTLNAEGGGQFTISAANFGNMGSIVAVDGGQMIIDPSISFANLDGSTLEGGDFEVDAGSMLTVDNSSGILVDDATIILDGSGSAFMTMDASRQAHYLDTTLAAIASDGVLELLSDRDWTSTTAMTNAGILELGGGTFAPESFANSGAVSGYGMIATTFSNDGVVSVDPGQTLSFMDGALTNLVGGTLTGGAFSVGDGGLLQLANDTSIVTLDAVLVLNGSGSVQGFDTVTGNEVGLKNSLATIGASGVLEILGSRVFGAANAVANLGVLQLGGAKFGGGKLTDGAGSTLSGFGAMASVFADSGAVTSAGGALTFSAKGDVFKGVLGGEEIDFIGGSDLLAGGASLTAATVALSGGAVATVDPALTFAGTLSANSATLTLAGHALTLGGRATLGSKALVNGTGRLAVSAEGTLVGAAGAGTVVVGVAVIDNGRIEASAGTLDLSQALTGAGAMQIDAGATLQVDAAAARSLTTTFAGSGATLALGTVARFASVIAGFGQGDVIELIKTTATAATLETGDRLLITNGSQTVATLTLSGDYVGDTFAVKMDQAGDAAITVSGGKGADAPPPGPNDTPPSAPGETPPSAQAGVGASLFRQHMAGLGRDKGVVSNHFSAMEAGRALFIGLTRPAVA